MNPDETQWVVLELTAKAENEDPDVVKASIRHHIRDAEIFVPASVVQRDDQRVYQYLMEGYAFIKDQHPPGHYSRLEETKYVQGPLFVPTGFRRDKRLATIPQKEINRLRAQIKIEVDQGIEVGDTVIITSGEYKNITAIVKEEIQEQDAVTVHIQLRSTDRLITLPRAFLRLEMKSPMVTFKPRVDALNRWVRAARKLLAWPEPDSKAFDQAVSRYTRWNDWFRRSRRAFSAVRAYHMELDFDPVWAQWERYQLLCRGVLLENQIFFISDVLPYLTGVEEKCSEVEFLSGAQTRITSIYLDVKRMTEMTPVNLVVDGTQLFIRCSEAPGLSALTDEKGRPTGGIVGFLRGLGAYHKRFPGVNIYVCWDGSSQRRKAMYSGYKANRSSRSDKPSFGIDWLKGTLPLLGVHQAFNPEEEADDVMASLVRGPLKEDPNILITTDRDLLQVVSENTHQLCPAVGAGKEKLYDIDRVQTEYGVPPESMVHIRALSGDSSDNIQGVSGFGLKTASKVIRLYGTVSALLESNFAGLGKTQVFKLRANEGQILKNVELLQLIDVPFNQIRSNPNQTEVAAKLQELGIKSEPILAAFFPQRPA